MKHISSTTLKSSYTLSWWGAALYYLSLALALLLVLMRTNHAFWHGLPFVGSYSPYLHITNFAISYVLLISLTLAFLYRENAWRMVVIAALLLVVANFIMEMFISILNTPDILDAVAGFLGVGAGLLAIAAIQHWWTKPVMKS